jgi:tRNA threonylcarbamoyladenosine biosynthesis protein TsaB
MKLLSIETSTAEGTLAIGVGDSVTELEIESPREQTTQILPIVDALLRKASVELGELDGIVFGRGPGSFTGLRVAAAVAQGLARPTGRPLLPVSSLAGLAHRAWVAHRVERALIAVDARMNQVYWASYRIVEALPAVDGAERIGDPDEVRIPDEVGWWAVGDGFAAYADTLGRRAEAAAGLLAELNPRASDLLPIARSMLAAGQSIAIEEALPTYLRDSSAWKPG